MSAWERFLDTFFNWAVITEYLPALGQGVLVTCQLAVAVVLTGLALGLGMALLRAYRFWAVNFVIVIFVDILRALPPLVLILILYFGLPNIGVTFSGFTVVWLVLSLVLAAFAEEIYWAGVLSVDQGQWLAARSTGLGFGQALIFVVLPQAMRMTIPPITNRTIAITKYTAIGMVVGVGEVLGQATTAQSFSGNASPLMAGALIYVALFLPLVVLSRWIEKRFAWRRA
ncbi:MAG: ABC transporter permease subunit [Rhodobacteraceae bacterium]|nr:ABC transporter permease subunit [Paracoccaceae bacterium]